MADDLRYKIGIDGAAAGRTLSGLQGGVSSLHGAFLALGGVGLFAKMLKDGFSFNQTLSDSEAAIGKVLAQFQHMGAEASKAAAAGAMQKLVALEPKAAGTLDTLIDGFLSTLAASQSAGISVEQNIDLVGRFANAMASAKIPTEQLGQEMRSIVTANIGADSSLAKVLGITNEMIQQAQEAGNVYGFLAKKLGDMGEASDTAAVRFSSLQSAIQQAQGALAAGLFDQAFEGSVNLTATLNENREAFHDLGSAITLAATAMGKLLGYIYDATEGYAQLGARIGLMVQDGASYSESSAAIYAVAAARKADAAAAEEEAKQAAVAAAATLSAIPQASAKKKKKEKDEDPTKIFDEVLSKQERLDELKRGAAEDEMTAAQKIASVRERLAAAAEREAAVKADPFSSDPRAALDAEEKRVELARELSQLLREEAQASDDLARKADDLARKAADKAAAARKEVEAHNQSRNNLLGELAILEAQASGHDKKAKALERQLRIANDTQAIMRDQQTSEEEALRLATRKADLEDKIAKRRERSNRDPNEGAHIGGVTKSKRGFGGLDEFDALQKGPTLGLAGPGRASSLDEFKKRQTGGGDDSIKLLGASRGQGLSDRLAKATTLAKPEAGGSKDDPNTSLLQQVVGELKRLRTA